MAIASLILGIIAIVLAAVGMVPLLGVLEFIALFLAIPGFIFGLIPIVKRVVAPVAIAGMVISILAIVIAVLRLALGGWFG
jgi:hypothetical protein